MVRSNVAFRRAQPAGELSSLTRLPARPLARSRGHGRFALRRPAAAGAYGMVPVTASGFGSGLCLYDSLRHKEHVAHMTKMNSGRHETYVPASSCVVCACGFFLILIFFESIFKINPGKLYLHQVASLRRAGRRGRWPLPRHMHRRGRGAMLASRGARGERGLGACRVTCTSAAALPLHPAWRGRQG
jgi:hypothetical protein